MLTLNPTMDVEALVRSIASNEQLGDLDTWVAFMAYQSANDAIKRLVSLGVLREIRRSGRTRKIFLAPRGLAALEE